MPLLPIPKKVYNSVSEITPDELRALGAEGALIDLDNTLAPYGSHMPTEEALRWLESLKNARIKSLVVSNGKKRRVSKICDAAGIGYVCSASKPRRKGLREGAQRLGLPCGRVAMIGDQVFTDVLGAVRCGMIPLIVNPMSMTKNPVFMLRRLIELPFIRMSGREK